MAVRSRPYDWRKRARFHWQTINGTDNTAPKRPGKRPPSVSCSNVYGESFTLCFDSWAEMREMVNTLRGELNAAFDRDVKERRSGRTK